MAKNTPTNIRRIQSHKTAILGSHSNSLWMDTYKLPAYCECSKKLDLQYALPCKKCEFVSLRYNFVRNITSSLLSEVCKDVRVEPQLQLFSGETFAPSTATGNKVRLGICVRGFWQTGQMVFFDARVFNPNARRYAKQEPSKT